MALLFSKSCEYAVQAIVFISIQREQTPFQSKDIAERLDIPAPYLAKTLQLLSKRGILRSIKGPNGGFTLDKPANKITLRDIVEAVDGLDNFNCKCVLGFPKCGEKNLCPVHDTWKEVKELIEEGMLSKTISELDEDLNNRLPDYVAEFIN
ncbi:MAG: Rrf2 family transcriptional regulator [bacterium]|nr:Rrf2 family transcriptional regulator [bacterium]